MNALAGEVAQLGIEERLAAFPNLDHQPHEERVWHYRKLIETLRKEGNENEWRRHGS